MATKKSSKASSGGNGLDAVADYRFPEATRKNNPPAKIAADGYVPLIPKAEYLYSPRRPPELRFDKTGAADELPELLAKATREKLTPEEALTLAAALRVHEPWLEWAGKREAKSFTVDPVALHIHERVSAQAILKVAAREDVNRSLFADPEQEYNEAVQFYRHDVDWSNRLILGDSLQVMSSLARREDLAGKVQMIYFDPPYGIRFKSNFQPEIGRRDVKDREADLTREPEMVKAYRDTWVLGVHSYLSYLRDRLIVARELLTETGSIFVQIGDENLHRVAAVLDEVFGRENAVVTITVKKKSSTTPTASVADYLLWYAREKSKATIRRVSAEIGEPEDDDKFKKIELPTGERRSASLIPETECKRLASFYLREDYPVVSQDPSATRSKSIVVQGRTVSPGQNHWRYDPDVAMKRLELAGRLRAGDGSAFAVVYWGDSGTGSVSNV